MRSPAQTQHFEDRVRPSDVSSYPLAGGYRCWRRAASCLVAVVVGMVLVGPGLWETTMHLEFMDTVLSPAASTSALEPLIGVVELSALLGVPVATIYDWRTRGEGPVAHRFGKHLRFAVTDVEAWIATHREADAPDSRNRQGGLPITSHATEIPGSLGLRIPHPHTPRRAISDDPPFTAAPMTGGEAL